MKATVAPAPTCDFSWTGFYLGARGGYGWSDGDIRPDGVPPGTFGVDEPGRDWSSDGFIGGGELGFNWQLGKWFVLGAETDLQWSDMHDRFNVLRDVPTSAEPADFSARQDIDWFGTARGRVGFAPLCRLLVYGTGGFAYGDEEVSADFDFRPNGGTHHHPISHDDTSTGWTAGGGVEFALTRHWTIKAEYLHVDLGDESRFGRAIPAFPPFGVRYHWDTQFHTVSGALNFKF